MSATEGQQMEAGLLLKSEKEIFFFLSFIWGPELLRN